MSIGSCVPATGDACSNHRPNFEDLSYHVRAVAISNTFRSRSLGRKDCKVGYELSYIIAVARHVIPAGVHQRRRGRLRIQRRLVRRHWIRRAGLAPRAEGDSWRRRLLRHGPILRRGRHRSSTTTSSTFSATMGFELARRLRWLSCQLHSSSGQVSHRRKRPR